MENAGPPRVPAPLKPMRYTTIIEGGAEQEIDVEELSPNQMRVQLRGEKFDIDLRKTGKASYSMLIGPRAFDFEVNRDGENVVVVSRHGAVRVAILDRARRAMAALQSREVKGRVEIKAIMAGRVVQVLVKEGDEVAADQGVLIVEAMKMENELKSPKAGKVTAIKVKAGQTVEKGDILAVIE